MMGLCSYTKAMMSRSAREVLIQNLLTNQNGNLEVL